MYPNGNTTNYIISLTTHASGFYYAQMERMITMSGLEVTTTNDLSIELSKREGVRTIQLEPTDQIRILYDDKEEVIDGPAILLLNQD